MRKLLLLFSSLLISVSAVGQITQLYMEDFEDPGQVFQVVNGITTTPPGTAATINWKDTTAHVVQGLKCYHVEGSSTLNDVWFETTDFSTIGFPYVFLSFTHVSKLFLANTGFVEISTDQGNSWRILNDTAYLGSSALYDANEYFNEGAYVAVNNLWASGQDVTPAISWWVQENFDLRGYAYDTINNNGFANVRLRFRARFNLDNPVGTGAFRDGWFVDTISVIGSVCELIPPTIDFNIGGSVCLDKPEFGVVEDPSNNYKVSLLANDKGAGIDSVHVIWDNGGVIDTATMTLVNAVTGEYTTDITNVFLGDTVKWYVEAFDLSCPNITRSPEVFVGDYCFWIDSGLPAKCGSPFCGALPTTISSANFPWTEDFEGSEWVAGNNGTTAGTDNQHRGNFPIFPTDYWVVAPSTSTANQNRYAWSIANNSTATGLTGPNSNNTPNGGSKYIYTESSTSTSISTQLITPCIDLTQSTKCYAFEYYYHMFGSDISILRIDIDTGADGSAWYNGYQRVLGEQQTNTTDAWKRGIISLEPFNGQMIRIRMFARRDNTTPFGDKSDIGIDDFRIFEPDPNEIEMISFESPVNGFCSYSANDTIDVIVRSNGCSTTSAIPLGYEVTYVPLAGPTTTTVSLDTIFDPLGLGDTTLYSFVPTANLSGFGTYTIKAWSSMPGDNDVTNDTVYSQIIEHLPTITTFPFIEDFESGSVGLQSVGNNNWRFDDGLDPNFRWQIGEGLTITRQTGPLEGYHFGGKYLYTETNGGGQQVSTFFRSLCVDLSGMTSPTLDFYYHFFGSDIAGMEVQVSRSGEDLDTWTTIVGSNVGVGQTEEKSNWSFKRVNLAAYAGEAVKLRFKANRNAGTDRADMAIDKIMIYDKIANDAGVFLINKPNRGVITYNATPTSPEVQVTNFGTSTISNVEVKIDITPLCGPNQGISTTYSQTVATNIGPGLTVTLPSLSTMNIAWPVGDFEICAYTNLGGDIHTYNDSACRRSNGLQIYNIPFSENFDPCGYDATGFNQPAAGDFYQWELGVPTASVINTAHSSPNVWATNLDGNYHAATEEIITFPILTAFDTVNLSEFRIWHWMEFDNNSPASSAGAIEYRQAGQWLALGGTNVNQNIGINWLGSQYGTQNSAVFNGPGFEGSTNGWLFSQYTITEFNSVPNALFRSRMRFRSNEPITTPQGATRNGWAFDDFELFVPGQHSASPISITTVAPLPIPGQNQDFEITIKNTGAQILDSCQIELVIDGNLIGSIDYYDMDPFMTRGQTKVVNFNHQWPGASVTSGVHQVMVVTHFPNTRGTDNIPFDDTLDVNLIVLDEIDMTTNMDSSYCNNFEGTDPNISPWIALNSDLYNEQHSWEIGAPIQFGAAFNGTNAWMTKLDSVYTNLDNSSLFSPIFIVDSGQTYEMSFYHWYDTEEFHDGGNVEVSFNGGLSWDPVGYYNSADSNWYDTQYVTALDIIKPGWTDTSGTWKLADQRIAFDNNGVKAIFRFRFAADYDINRPGWAIDQFCFNKVDSNAQQVIGREEYQLPEDLVVADLSPNPTNDFSELSIFSPTPKAGSYVIVNSIGQLMHSEEINLRDGINKIALDGSKWDSGIYIVRVSIENEIFTKKLILTR